MCHLILFQLSIQCLPEQRLCVNDEEHFFNSRLPGLESSKANKIQEDSLYDEMMSLLLQIVTQPLVADTSVTSCSVPSVQIDAGAEIKTHQYTHGFWNLVQGPSPVEFGSENLWKNLLNWRAFTRKNRSKVMV